MDELVSPAAPLPPDQRHRDTIALDHDATLFVEAGAGTGKTHALVTRILNMVRNGKARIGRIAAITFTEKAAGELRERLRAALTRAATEAVDPAERERLEQGVLELNAAAIQTIHGFCRRILNVDPLAAGLPPGFEVMDAVAASVELQERWDAYLASILDAPPDDLRPALERVLLIGLRPQDLWCVARDLVENFDRLEVGASAAAALAPFRLREAIACIDGLLAHMERCTNPADKLYVRMAEVLPDFRARMAQVESAAPPNAFAERWSVLETWPDVALGAGTRADWGGDVATVRDAIKESRETRAAICGGVRSAALVPIVAHIAGFALDAAESRRRSGRLAFQDLLVLAHRALRDNPAVRARVHGMFDRLFVDEFQDTDPLQVDIIFLVAGRVTDGPPPPWTEAEVEPGRLFFVGDPKQSIYRFRRADVALYLRVREAMRGREGAAIVPLSHNFRSVEPVVEWVNRVFPAFMQQDDPVTGSVAYASMSANRQAETAGEPRVHVLGGAQAGPASDVREAEGIQIAAAIRHAQAEGWAQRLSDITLLMPSRTAWPFYADALHHAAIPYRLEAQSLLYATQEVTDLMNILRAIDDPSDQVALIAALRSTAFACSDRDLLDWRQAGGTWAIFAPMPQGVADGQPVAAAIAWLRQLANASAITRVSGLLERVIRERRLLEVAVGEWRPRDIWSRIGFLLDQARAFDEAGAFSVRPFIEWVDRQAEERARVGETPQPDPDDDAVRVLTIHAAKGLQFPVVILAGLNSKLTARPEGVIWSDEGFEVRVGSRDAGRFETPGYAEAAELEACRQAADDARLMYVAATRAQNRMLVSLHHTRDASLASQLAGALGDARELTATFDVLPVPEPLEPAMPAWPAPPSTEQRRQWIEARSALIEQNTERRTLSATAYARLVAGDGDDAEEDEKPAYRRGIDGTNVGRAVHAVLQTVDLDTGAGAPETARAQAAAEGVEDRTVEVEGLVAKALAAAPVREAVHGGRFWREVFVSTSIEGTLIEGFIDLLYEAPDGLVVLDYKTDSASAPGQIETAMERYRHQATLYAAALEATLNRPVARCVFVFLRASGDPVRVVSDLPAAIADLRRRLATGEPASLPTPVA